jgi:hypothetical protein
MANMVQCQLTDWNREILRRLLMVVTLDSKLEAALKEKASEQGIAAEELALKVLRERLLAGVAPEPRDEWERGLLEAARDCGVSLPDSALGSEGLYD